MKAMMQNNEVTLMILIDLIKAFDLIKFKTVLKKAQYWGVLKILS